MIDSTNIGEPESIAIIGMSGRFPGARDVAEFWRNLCDGVESITQFSDAELLARGTDPAALAHPNFVKANAILDDVDLFDAALFGYSARDAQIMDPQQRVFLECAWDALENAGYDPTRYPGLIGVFAGSAMSTYLQFLYASLDRLGFVDPYQMLISNEKDFLATNVSYKLNLRGPSIAIQTACSTSLVAVSIACQNLLNYHCDIALAGGVAISVPQRRGYMYAPEGIVSPDGHCRAFDAAGQGMVGGNGVGIVVLKRLSEALAEGDCIRAIIRGFGINNDGAVKVGFTAPGVEGQAQVIAMAQAMAGVHPDSVTYVEAHGTATALGDPIEVAALTEAFRAHTERRGFCALGSVKTNIGHLDPAAGVAGLIKTVLALEHRMLPPSLHFEKPNPRIDFDSTPFFVNNQLRPWLSADGQPLRAGVSSFGIGGTNAHVVLEEAPPRPASTPGRPSHLLLLSARTASALEAQTDNLANHLLTTAAVNLADVAFTTHVGRRALANRRFVVSRGPDREDVARALEERDPTSVYSGVADGSHRPVAFMFPGQGTQYPGMARGLYEVEPVFRAAVDHCAELLKPPLGRDIRDVMFEPSPDGVELTQTALAQPVLFTVEYSLAALWTSFGIQPHALIGHSIGEYVAACLAGVFSLEDALTLVAERGRLMQLQPHGSMAAVPLSELELQPLLDGRVSLAAINGPATCVISGPRPEVEQFAAELAQRGLPCRPLHTSHAFHSSMMDPAVAPFVDSVRHVRLNPPVVPFVSNVSGTWITPEDATDPEYWGRQLRQPVRFSKGVQALVELPNVLLLEVGPGATLGALARQQLRGSSEHIVVDSLQGATDRNRTDSSHLLHALGRLWLAGVEIEWAGFHAHEARQRVPLPTYPFERQRYWVGPLESGPLPESGSEPDADGLMSAAAAQPWVRYRQEMSDWFWAPTWKLAVPASRLHMNQPVVTAQRWLVFSDDGQLAAAAVDALTGLGKSVVTMRAGDAFEHIGRREYVIRPGARSDYDAVLQELQTADGLPDAVLHFWNLPALVSQPASPAGILERGFYSLIAFAQALGEVHHSAPIDVGVVASQLQATEDGEAVCPEKATVLGACRVIPQEYPGLLTRAIDVVLPQSAGDRVRLVDHLLTELSSEPYSPLVAYRRGRRWLPVVEPVRLEGAPDTPGRLRQHGTYLITGGLGGIGLSLAEYLATSVQARLVLIGRSAPLSREDWPEWLHRIEAAGAEVLVARADVADLDSMREIAAAARERFGPLHGIIHTAGVAGGGIVQLKTREIAESVLRPKVAGTRVLHEVFGEESLDFVVLCSSLTALYGGPGQVDYCAANAYLDAFAESSPPAWRYVVSVNWDAWREVGMAVNTPVPAEMEAWRAETLRTGIGPDEGGDVLARILDTDLRRVAVSTTGMLDPIQGQAAFVAAPTSAESDGGASGDAAQAYGLHPRPAVAATYVAPETETQQTIAWLWQQLLGIERVGIYDDFFELGGHSLLAIQLLSHLRELMQLEISVKDLFDARTVAGLAAIAEASSPSSSSTSNNCRTTK